VNDKGGIQSRAMVDKPSEPASPLSTTLALLAAGALALCLAGCSTTPTPATVAPVVAAQTAPPSPEADFGIRVEALRLSAAGAMLDFRYRVLDPAKAAPLLDGRMKPYLLDEARGAKLGVPESPVLGRIRQTARNNKILTDRTYFIMFGNPGKALRSGDKVTLLLGELKLTGLQVQ
jgi:hypothetical protein